MVYIFSAFVNAEVHGAVNPSVLALRSRLGQVGYLRLPGRLPQTSNITRM